MNDKIADACLVAAHESIEELEAALTGTAARVAALESILCDLVDEDQLQCQAPSWLENGDYYPCDACSCCKAKALVRKL